MALKERKQITGTTAQINAYEGHEGQILWDKEKKTLVGMSGTAGKNYPLASKEYVDSTCLPLTGGTVTGPIHITEDNYISAIALENVKGLEICGGRTWKDGAGLFLRNNSATGEGESGQWGLVAQNVASGTEGVLMGHADNLWFNGALVERSNEILESSIEGGFYAVYRYATGLQIIIVSITIPAN